MDDHLAWWYNAPRDMYTIAHHDGSTYTPWMVSVSCHQIMLIQSFGIHSAQEARLTDGQRRAARLLTLKLNPHIA